MGRSRDTLRPVGSVCFGRGLTMDVLGCNERAGTRLSGVAWLASSSVGPLPTAPHALRLERRRPWIKGARCACLVLGPPSACLVGGPPSSNSRPHQTW